MRQSRVDSDKMKVLIVNTSLDAGGAAVAARRLMEALVRNGAQARMLVRDLPQPLQKSGDECQSHDSGSWDDGSWVSVLPCRWMAKWHFLWERFVLFVRLGFRREHLFDIDAGISGTDITRLRVFREADVIHLHWVNQGMLSLRDLRKIIRSGKAVVWTMHDAWPSTAICHLTLGCRQFTSQCSQCKYLASPDPSEGGEKCAPASNLHPALTGGERNAWLARVWRRKERLLRDSDITFVACSRWLEGEAKVSAMLRGQHIVCIPNPIDTSVFCPGDRQEARREEGLPIDRRLVLFVCQRLTNAYKGMDYLIEACRRLADEHPDMKDEVSVVLLGSHADEVAAQLQFPAIALGYVSDEQRMVRLYRAADVFVLPSLSENLPNTIMEAMACGVPCLGFRVGGIPEEIDHQRTGYVARYRDAADLARGLRWLLYEADSGKMARECVRKVEQCYSQTAVAVKYTEVYQQALAHKHFAI